MIAVVVGARPNFIKMASVVAALQQRGLPLRLVHTGQHYDVQMSDVFFQELTLPPPDVHLGVGSGSHAEQTARILFAFERFCLEQSPELVVVAGDVNSTLACALVAAKLHLPVAHVESGLRSFDRSMPEEINRVVADHLADLLFTPEPIGAVNLDREGIAPEKIHFVGNSTIDALKTHLDAALRREPWTRFHLPPGEYGLVTFHRPANVDDPAVRRQLAAALARIAPTVPLLFPIHPRTLSRSSGEWNLPNVTLTEPLGYLDFIGLIARARFVLSDSGGVQAETTTLGVPCVTVRQTTEFPVTLSQGTNRLVAPEAEAIAAAVFQPLNHVPRVPDLWDGCAGERIAAVIDQWRRGR